MKLPKELIKTIQKEPDGSLSVLLQYDKFCKLYYSGLTNLKLFYSTRKYNKSGVLFETCDPTFDDLSEEDSFYIFLKKDAL